MTALRHEVTSGLLPGSTQNMLSDQYNTENIKLDTKVIPESSSHTICLLSRSQRDAMIAQTVATVICVHTKQETCTIH